MAEPIVRVDGVSHAYGQGALRTQVLHAVSAEIHPGEIVILTGPSGSGKTTLLTLVGALRSGQEGSLHVLGEELVLALASQDRYMGSVFVTPKGQRDYDERVEKAYAAYKLAGGTKDL